MECYSKQMHELWTIKVSERKGKQKKIKENRRNRVKTNWKAVKELFRNVEKSRKEKKYRKKRKEKKCKKKNGKYFRVMFVRSEKSWGKVRQQQKNWKKIKTEDQRKANSETTRKKSFRNLQNAKNKRRKRRKSQRRNKWDGRKIINAVWSKRSNSAQRHTVFAAIFFYFIALLLLRFHSCAELL